MNCPNCGRPMRGPQVLCPGEWAAGPAAIDGMDYHTSTGWQMLPGRACPTCQIVILVVGDEPVVYAPPALHALVQAQLTDQMEAIYAGRQA